MAGNKRTYISKFSWEVKELGALTMVLTQPPQGRSQDFSNGGHTGSNNIVMAFSPRNIVGCLL